MVQVWVPMQLRSFTAGQEMVEVAGQTVGEVIASLDADYPGIRDRLCEGDSLKPGLAVVIGSQVARRGLLEKIPPGSEVHFLPAIAGGLQ